MAIHPREAETVYVVPEFGAERRYVCGGQLGVWRSRNCGKSWKLLTRGLPQKNVYSHVMRHAMSTEGVADGAGIYLGTTGGEIFHSRDSGDTWQLLHAHLASILSLETALV